jgi:putative endonuclease
MPADTPRPPPGLSRPRGLKRPGEISGRVVAPPATEAPPTAPAAPAPRGRTLVKPGAILTAAAARGQKPGASTPRDVEVAERTRHETGLSAESRAAAALVTKGFRILARRVRTPAGELDIVAAKGKLLVFVEVKARPSFEQAAESITPRQRQRLIAAAEAFLAKQAQGGAGLDVRFDVMLVVPGRPPRHLIDAISAE